MSVDETTVRDHSNETELLGSAFTWSLIVCRSLPKWKLRFSSFVLIVATRGIERGIYSVNTMLLSWQLSACYPTVI